MPCPHHDVKIIQRSKGQSAVASAAYQSGERLFSEYDQKQKYYSHKSEIVHTEIMLPPHAPPDCPRRRSYSGAAQALCTLCAGSVAISPSMSASSETPNSRATATLFSSVMPPPLSQMDIAPCVTPSRAASCG